MAHRSFYIIDGHAQIFRAYFAPFRELVAASGEPTKATYVFTQMLLNLVDQRKPDYLAMVIDSGDETVFRKEIHPEYKANRQKPPDDFLPQEERILRIVRDAGVPLFVLPGFEADDLIATMARKLCGSPEGWDIYLVSKDKDLRQILNACTRMYDVQSDEVIDEKMLEAKVGYGPKEAVEVQTLMGDAIDNVPGIPGVGEKTAAKLIKKYGSADAVLQHLDELTPKMRENFEKYADRLPLARSLVRLRDDLEFDFNPEACGFKGLNAAGLRPHLAELGFTSLLKKLETIQPAVAASPNAPAAPIGHPAHFEESLFGPSAPSTPGPATPSAAPAATGLCTGENCDYQLINTPALFESFLRDLKQQSRFAFDTETDALGAMRSNLVGMSFSWKAGQGFYLPVRGPAGSECLPQAATLAALKPILEDPSIRKVGHNIKYDMLVMRVAGINLRGIEMDSMVGAFLIDSSRIQYGIDSLARDLLGFQKVATHELIGKGKNQTSMDQVELGKISRYAAEDADIALRLCDLVADRMKKLPEIRKLNDELETPLIDVLAEMEFNGVSIDPAILREQSEAMAVRIDELRGQVMAAAGIEFNPDSPKQLADVLFNRLKLRPGKKTKTGFSTDVEVLEKLAGEHAVPKLILEHRSLVKLKNTYLDNLTQYVNARTGRIHASFNQTGAATGRLSCSDPNLQNIPIRTEEGRRIRLAFVPGDRQKTVLLTADYSQIELRFLAHFTLEPALVKAFEADEDIHSAVAAEVFSTPLDQVSKAQRNQAKIINFGIIYGISAGGLARRIDGLNIRAAQGLIDAYNRRFPAIEQFLHKCVLDAQAQGYVSTILGRRRPIPDISSAVLSVRNASERMAINSVVQGSAADLIKMAMVNIHRRMQKQQSPSRLLMQVHDELVFETPADAVEAESNWIREEMTGAMQLKVPLRVSVGHGKNWEEGK